MSVQRLGNLRRLAPSTCARHAPNAWPRCGTRMQIQARQLLGRVPYSREQGLGTPQRFVDIPLPLVPRLGWGCLQSLCWISPAQSDSLHRADERSEIGLYSHQSRPRLNTPAAWLTRVCATINRQETRATGALAL